MGNSIIADNTRYKVDTGELAVSVASNCNLLDSADNFLFSITSYRSNVIEADDACRYEDVFLAENDDYNQIGTDDQPLDAGLNNVSMFPRPHIILSESSSAIDQGIGDVSPAFFSDCPDHDTIGNPRPIGVVCDAGAVERQPVQLPLEPIWKLTYCNYSA